MRLERSHHAWRAIWVVACALPLLLSLSSCDAPGFFTAFSRSVRTLPWVSLLLPSNGGTNTEKHSPVIAVGNGERLYDCLTPPAGTLNAPQLWVTDDHAQHWRHVSDVPMPGSVGVGQSGVDCLLIGDDLDGARLVATLFPSGAFPATTTQPSTSYFSADGGATWRALPNVDGMRVIQLATHAGLTYALRVAGPPAGTGHSTLSVSDDALQSWRAVDADIQRDPHHVPSIPFIRGFWLRAEDGLLVAQSDYLENRGGSIVTTLWRSADGGTHWSRQPLPAGQDSLGAFTNLGTKPRPMCTHPHQEGEQSWCTLDGGLTWHQILKAHSAKYPDRLASAFPIALTVSGDLIAWVSNAERPDDGPNGTSLQRLRAGASAWEIAETEESVGKGLDFFYEAPPGGGVLWRMPQPLAEFHPAGNPTRRIYYLPYSAIK